MPIARARSLGPIVEERRSTISHEAAARELDIFASRLDALFGARVFGLENVPAFVADALESGERSGPIDAAGFGKQAILVLAVHLADAIHAQQIEACRVARKIPAVGLGLKETKNDSGATEKRSFSAWSIILQAGPQIG